MYIIEENTTGRKMINRMIQIIVIFSPILFTNEKTILIKVIFIVA